MLALRLKRAEAARTSKSRRWLATASKVKAINRVRGTRDLLADDAEQHRQVLDVLQRTVNRYGFRQVRTYRMIIQTPLLEYTDLFSRSLGDGSDIVMKEMYTFEDNSGKSVTLRPEGTAGIMRALVSNNLLFSLPQKLAYSGSMFRYERPQRGRYREFQQFGVEFVGSSGPSVDAEIIAMAADALEALGIKDKVTLELNSLGDSESRTRYRVALEGYFSQYKDELSTDSINRSFLFLPEIRQTAYYKNQCESLRQLSGTEARML
ncbi:hypothetical protein BBO99_00001484 [Phytophthora kernoviae]|uniref:histidine--tRNA ligase n=2 Tax=Phytophthora kernoviae TaxID=325452 RepID=A0A3R7J989_9STRA|nr:hypothetical protein G195_003152 [Phytophthora kernoviae 00238/432]KAG2529134.1 hypothetical protein JM16_002150 [Phytophthora kernoviae]KAG2532363.1 hypothetical protein JM18_001264 [Phytophthora kernoviae]RLN43847.1 hypothetical protein BBI17_001203 [Phytophthora kernoviae]RLN84274.1 hypothetical protein BBO99_00001484 [Phytophthora kernoviae]